MKTLVIFVCLCLSISAWARLGMTSKECEKKYGSPVWGGDERSRLANYVAITRKLYKLNSNYEDKYNIYLHICFIDDKAELIAYCKYKKDENVYLPTLFKFPHYNNSFSYEEEKQMKKANGFDSSKSSETVKFDSKGRKVAGYSDGQLSNVIESCFINQNYEKWVFAGYQKNDSTSIFYCFAGGGTSIFFTGKIVKFAMRTLQQEYRQKIKKEKSKVDEINF